MTQHSQDAHGYLDQHGASGRALTKAEHDRLVEKKGRPATDHGYRLIRRNTSTTPSSEE